MSVTGRARESVVRASSAIVGGAIERFDRSTNRRRPASHTSSHGANRAAPRVVAAISHWRVDERFPYLVGTIEGVARQGAQTGIVICTNEAEIVRDRLKTTALGDQFEIAVVAEPDCPRFVLDHDHAIACMQWEARGHPFRLTWAHKRVLGDLVLHHDVFSKVGHLIYLEDDLQMAEGALAYWSAYRPVLAPFGLIPGFTRGEGPEDAPRSTSLTDVVQVSRLPQLVVTDALSDGMDPDPDAQMLFVNLGRPYQGMYVLDEELAAEHFRFSLLRSCRRSKFAPGLGGTWGVRERAAAGPIFDGVPDGFVSRNVIPLLRTVAGGGAPLPQAVVRHLPANYHTNPAVKRGKIRLDEAFVFDAN
jgi:hypothetical protein